MILINGKKDERFRLLSNLPSYNFWILPLILSGCGAGKSTGTNETKIIGFPSSYIAPKPNFEPPTIEDPNFKIVQTPLVEGYWIKALEMSEGQSEIGQLLLNYDREIKFSFPIEAPAYVPVYINGWSPANTKIKDAAREIFTKLNEVINVEIKEMDTAEGFNNLAISQSVQASSAAFSYFPHNQFQLGSDIFISKNYSNPLALSENLTNYDYEVLLHEIGHALGLKHPFEGAGNNLSVLNAYEDHTKFTAMSYDDELLTFDGTFRSLDWMTLTKFYGVNPEFRSGDDVYNFDDLVGQFIIDGNGIDTIKNSSSIHNIFIDLRPGTHSYEAQKSIYITDANQLTISHGSEIENVQTGSGDDTIIGNHIKNIIYSGNGDDIIFPGEGEDTIYPSYGENIVDLSEDVNVRDTIVIEEINEEEQHNVIYGFNQGIFGDILDITDLNLPNLTSLPLVDVLNVPAGYINNSLVKIFGTGLGDADSMAGLFGDSGRLENLKLSNGNQALLVTATSQYTGEAQNIYSIHQNSGFIEIHHLAHLVGNYLDIDNWSLDNFLI